MALSKIYKVGDVYSRIANKCGNVKDFQLDQNTLVRIMIDGIMAIWSAANASGKKYYYGRKPLSVVSGAIDISAENFFEVQSVAYENGTSSRAYNEAKNPTEFNNKRTPWNHEAKATARVWMLVQGDDPPVIAIHQGTAAVGEDTLTVYYVRYPEINFDYEKVEQNVNYIDLTEWMVNHYISYCAAQAVQEQNLALPAGMEKDFAAAVSNLDLKIQQTEEAARGQKRDTL